MFNSDKKSFGGSGISNPKILSTDNSPWNTQKHSVEITIPPLGIVVFKYS